MDAHMTEVETRRGRPARTAAHDPVGNGIRFELVLTTCWADNKARSGRNGGMRSDPASMLAEPRLEERPRRPIERNAGRPQDAIHDRRCGFDRVAIHRGTLKRFPFRGARAALASTRGVLPAVAGSLQETDGGRSLRRRLNGRGLLVVHRLSPR
jgi:hypothetical protein